VIRRNTMSLLAAFKSPAHWGAQSAQATSRWLESTLESARWEKMRQAGRRWGWWGAVLGLIFGVVAFAPATWLAEGVSRATSGRLLLAEAEGTVWAGSAVAVLTGGKGSRDARALPGRLGWQLRPAGLGVRLSFTQDCCLSSPLTLVIKPGLGRLSAEISSQSPSGVPVGQWPTGWLMGLGTPWNTLQLTGMLGLETRSLRLDWVQGRLRVEGQANITLRDTASRVTTLNRLGSYRLSVLGSAQSDVALTLLTEDGVLQLNGQGSLGPSGLRFRGEARADQANVDALGNLLNIIGRRNGDHSVISIG
jgi:general secretion pathway protein N